MFQRIPVFQGLGGSYKVVDSESFNFYSPGFWASERIDQVRLGGRRVIGFRG